MRINNLKLKNPVLIVFVFYFLFSILNHIHAQTSPQFLVSWQAQNYAPSWYQGKFLPIKGTTIEVNFDLIDSGKIADLSKTKIRWYVNDALVLNEDSGLGIKTLKFNTPDSAGNNTEVRIAIVDYKGNALNKIITIPIVNPEAVIEAPYVDQKISSGSSVFKAVPFFFNVNNPANLSVNWSIGTQQPKNPSLNPYILELNVESATPSGTGIQLSVMIKKGLESAGKSVNLTVK